MDHAWCYMVRARGEENPDSDRDLHILIPGTEKLPASAFDKYAWPFYELGLFNFDEEVNARVYSQKEWADRKSLPFYKNVEKDAITLYQS
ncbi:MAG: hypothetical protein NC336_05610 [Clostridium sp.]|nr:hypothetical protein [Clostridium sp.]